MGMVARIESFPSLLLFPYSREKPQQPYKGGVLEKIIYSSKTVIPGYLCLERQMIKKKLAEGMSIYSLSPSFDNGLGNVRIKSFICLWKDLSVSYPD